MSSSRFTFGKVMDSVGAAASTITTTLTTIESAVNLAAAAVEDLEYKQAVRNAIGRDGYVANAAREAALEEAKSISALSKAVEKGDINAEDYDSAYARIMDTLVSKQLITAEARAKFKA